MPATSPLYLFERSEVGVVIIDRELKVTSMNSYARRVLPVQDMEPFEKMVLTFHPERSQPKVRFLLDQSECPVSNPPPMAMIINIPERVLLIKVTKLSDAQGQGAGHTLIFHDITDMVSNDEEQGRRPEAKRRLQKVPTVSQGRIVLIDAGDVTYVRAEGHYTWVSTLRGSSFCNLSISDLSERLDGGAFMRIHRSFVANLEHTEQIVREDGRVGLRMRGDAATLPVSRTSVPQLLARLGIAEADAPKG